MKAKNLYKRIFKMLRAFFYIFLFLGLGELTVYLVKVPIPGNIIGMILIFAALKLKLIKLESVKPASNMLINYMMLFFVPFGVGLMSYFDFIKSYGLVLIVAVGISSLITLYVTAFVQQKLEKDDRVL